MNKYIKTLSFYIILSAFTLSCTREQIPSTGSFTDEFGNRFVLNDDSTATIQFAGMTDIETSYWHIVKQPDGMVYASIYYNGNPEYYYLSNNKLYRYKEDMLNNRNAIEINYE